jgi:glucose/arabinose dehydrogenase
VFRRTIALLTAAGALTLGLPASANALPRRAEVRLYKSGLSFPVDMAWVKGTKRFFFTEKNTGKVRIMQGKRLLGRACVNLDVASSGEQGALGIVLHPRFKRNKWLYVMYTHSSGEMRVTRFTVNSNRCRRAKHILTGVPASSGYHNGGQLEFVGKKLFVSTGENHSAAAAQDTNNRLGKILRYNANGTVPDSNPFKSLTGAPLPVWSYGHRNPFGLAVRPGTFRLYETENGPSCDDELNRIRKGRNYGWGSGYECGTRGVGDNPKRPLRRWSDIIVPTDPTWYVGKLKALRNNLFVPDFEGGLHKIIMNRRGSRVREDRIIYRHAEGIVDVSRGPGKWLYFLTPTSIFRIVRRRDASSEVLTRSMLLGPRRQASAPHFL